MDPLVLFMRVSITDNDHCWHFSFVFVFIMAPTEEYTKLYNGNVIPYWIPAINPNNE